MEKIIALLKKLGIELTADQTKQLEEIGAKERQECTCFSCGAGQRLTALK